MPPGYLTENHLRFYGQSLRVYRLCTKQFLDAQKVYSLMIFW